MPSRGKRRTWGNHPWAATRSGNGEGPFHFVSVDPSSADQRTLDRALIRSNAGKHVWRKHRTHHSGVRNSSPSPVSTSSPFGKRSTSQLTRSTVSLERSPRRGDEEETASDSQIETWVVESTPRCRCPYSIQGPLSLLENGFADPFHTYQSTLGESMTSRLMRYCKYIVHFMHRGYILQGIAF
jgi:hypothetical protein